MVSVHPEPGTAILLQQTLSNAAQGTQTAEGSAPAARNKCTMQSSEHTGLQGRCSIVSSHRKYCAGMVGSLRSTQSLMLQSFCSAPDAIMARLGLQATASTASQCPLPSASLPSLLSLPGILWTICRMPWQY